MFDALHSTPPRRAFLRGTGACLALPWLESLASRFSAAAEPDAGPPRRMIAIMTDLGMVPEFFFPKGTGRDYEESPYLAVLARHRDQVTVFSGLSHPEVEGGHQTDVAFFTGAPHPRKPGFKNSISVDQYAAAELGPVTRFPTLPLRVGPVGKTLSYSSDGVALPSEHRPSAVYRSLFLQGPAIDVEEQIGRLRDGQSLMDQFAEQLRSLERDVTARDRQRLEQYLGSVREVEQRLQEGEAWERKPKPEVDVPLPEDNLDPAALIERTRAMYDLARLAVETDSTRLVTIFVTQQFNPKVDLPGVEIPHHALTHQMSVAESRAQLKVVEEAQLAELARLLDGLAAAAERGESLLDRTMVLYGSNLGNAARHDNTNLPALLAGGGFRHGQHLAFDSEHNEPLCNLYVSMLQRLGVDTDRFGTGTRTITGLEPA